MSRTRIAIACQGGGSQCAFVAGALKTLLEQGVHNQYRIVGLSGTSGGSINAALAWEELLEQARGKEPVDRLTDCWKDMSAKTALEQTLDQYCLGAMRLIERGFLPSFASTPSSLQSRMLVEATSRLIGRPEFTDLRTLLLKHIDFDALPALVRPDSPVLLVGAADILEGTFKIFSSVNNEIKVEALLASAAIPNLFPAVQFDGHAYWDGIFSSNPPVVAFLKRALMGKDMLPEEIWILQVNRSSYDFVPERPSDIFDRRNQLAGNLSLRHELEVIQMVNTLLREDALTDTFRARFGIDLKEPITVRFLRMSDDMYEDLDYPSKLSRQPHFIDKLLAHGEEQAHEFLRSFLRGDRPEITGEEAGLTTH
jgi:NTE family protein